MHRLATLALLLSAVFSIACANHADTTRASARLGPPPGWSQEEFGRLAWTTQLAEIQRRFASAVAAGRIDDAARLVDPPRRAAFREVLRNLQRAQLTQVVVEGLEVEPLLDRATGQVRYHGLGLITPVVVTQEWRHDRARGRWFVRPEIDVLRQAADRARPTRLPAALDEDALDPH